MTTPDDKTLDDLVRLCRDEEYGTDLSESCADAIAVLRERIAALEAERDALKDELRQANGVRDVFASAVVAQAMQEVDKMPNPQESPVDKSTGLQGPDPNGVICL